MGQFQLRAAMGRAGDWRIPALPAHSAFSLANVAILIAMTDCTNVVNGILGLVRQGKGGVVETLRRPNVEAARPKSMIRMIPMVGVPPSRKSNAQRSNVWRVAAIGLLASGLTQVQFKGCRSSPCSPLRFRFEPKIRNSFLIRPAIWPRRRVKS